MGEPSTQALAARYTRGTAVAAVVVTAVWHLVNDSATVVLNWSGYRWQAAVLAAWACYAVVASVASVGVLGRGVARHPWVVVGSALAITLVVGVASQGLVSSFANWGWGAAGWLGVLACWNRSVAPLVVVTAGAPALNVLVLFAVGSPSRVAVVLIVMSAFGAAALQWGLVVAARALADAADRAVRASTARGEAEARRAAGEAVHLARLRRYEWLQRTAARVLAGLASGASDPRDPEVRRQCAVEAARLRRAFLETEDLPDPLLHEVRACADVAEHRGLIVDLRSAGPSRPVPREVRRALVEPLIQVLAEPAVTGRVRVTLVVAAGEVAVSVVATADVALEIPSRRGWVRVQQHQEGDRLWVESRWRGR